MAKATETKETKEVQDPTLLKAFRCKACGHLHHAGHAGDNALPHACCVCGSGVVLGMDPADMHAILTDPDLSEEQKVERIETLARRSQGAKKYVPENWEVLAGCDDKTLAKYGLTRDQVTKHEAKTPADPAGGCRGIQ